MSYCVESDEGDTFAKIGDIIPESLWKDSDFAISVIELHVDMLVDHGPIEFYIPSDNFWEEEDNLWRVVNIVIESNLMDYYSVFEIIPPSLSLFISKNKAIAMALIERDYNFYFYELPEELKGDKDVIRTLLTSYNNMIEGRRNAESIFDAWSYDVINKNIEYFLSKLPDFLWKDKEFIVAILEYDFLGHEIDWVLDWMDQELRNDKDFMEYLERRFGDFSMPTTD